MNKLCRSFLRNAFKVNNLVRRHASKAPSCLFDILKQQIKATGPITVAHYMKESLTNPMFGYYMKNDVFGEKGDFITSPEVSQVFGELVGVWMLAHWMELGRPNDVQLVELGPGRGILVSDIIRVFHQFPGVAESFSVHLVEVSDTMIKMQRKSLNVSQQNAKWLTSGGVEVTWYSQIEEVPKGMTFYLANEFFDALPIHLFKRDGNLYKEILISLTSDEKQLQFVTAPGPSPLAQTFIDPSTTSDSLEVCPQAAAIIGTMSDVIASEGGCAFIVDYGELQSERFSLRGFQQHKTAENILENPGTFDITANVDFSFLQRCTQDKVSSHGPITQRDFLLNMGIQQRIKALLQKSTAEQSKNLMTSYKQLVGEMGEKFKLMAVTPKHAPLPHCFKK